MQKQLIKHLIFVVLFSVLISCSGGQSETVLPTPAQDNEPIQEALPTETPETPAEIETIPCELALPASDDWEVVLCEQFDDNKNNWEVESQDNPYARYTSTITDGKFVVDYSAKAFAGFQRTALTWFTIGEVKDFALSIKGLMDSQFQDVSWGIAFRGDEDSFFLFSILNNGTYKFEIYEDGGWINLISPKVTMISAWVKKTHCALKQVGRIFISA